MTEENKVATPEEVLESLDQGEQAADQEDQAQPETPAEPESDAVADELSGANQVDEAVPDQDPAEADAEAAMLAMLDELPQEDSGARPEDIDFGPATAAKAEFQQLTESSGKAEKQNIDLLMDVNLPVSIELGRTKMTIEDILALGPGSVVELNKLAGEPVDLMVNYKVVARGEVVVIDENFGVRITQLLSPEERLRALGDQ